MRCLKTWQKSATFIRRTQGGAGSLPPKVAEKLHAPVREVCIQIMGSMRSIAARPRLVMRVNVCADELEAL